MPKYRVILDTNIIISAVCFPSSTPHEVYNEVGNNHILKLTRDVATFIDDTSFVNDPPDNDFLALAIDGKADYLVTGDKKHLMFSDIQEKDNWLTICTVDKFSDSI